MYLLANIFGVENWIIILGVVLLLFGGQKIPELMRGVGKGVGELQKGLEEGKRSLNASLHDDEAKKREEEARKRREEEERMVASRELNS